MPVSSSSSTSKTREASRKPKVFVGADHGGYALKTELLAYLREQLPGWDLVDLGTESEESVDYPDFAHEVARQVVRENAWGLLVCGSGIGMSIAANKVDGIRAALVWDATSARLSRQHNDANILCLGARLIGAEVAREAVSVWFRTGFDGGRHQRRVDRIGQIEREV